MELPNFSAVKIPDQRTALQFVRTASNNNLGIPIMVLMLLGMMILPLPAFLLDMFFSFNIALSIVVLLVGVYSLRPLDFAVFPTILLVATLFRLALNVASTRVVLLEGHTGADAAGKVIQAFGEVVIGGNYAVGLVVFLILLIINFVVVTKGAGRISEVSARFTLDAMPGKQMAIDADLNAGLIGQEEAKERRAEVASEADFYGAMDGASKFVRGDAVAGILILIINIVGGLSIGMAQHQLVFADALEKYILLTIGDGLVAQIPSLLLSVSAAIMVTRVNSSEDVRSQVLRQMFDSPKALGISAVILFLMGVIPGMPHVAFLGLAMVCGALAYLIYYRQQQAAVETVAPNDRAQALGSDKSLPANAKREGDLIEAKADPVDVSWDDVMPVDIIGLEVGYRLIPLVDQSQGGELLGRIKGVRKKLSQEMGFLIPSVHIRDNLDLLPNQYRLTLMGVALGEAEVFTDKEMAINPGQVFGKLEGSKTTDPAFGLEAVWIDAMIKDKAQTLGYTVVDASTVIATHLNQIMHKHSDEMLGHEDIQQLLDNLAKSSPKLVEELVPNTLTLNVLRKVLQGLLREHVSIRDFRSIAEAITGFGQSQDPDAFLAVVRKALARQIVQNIIGNGDELAVLTLDPALEQILLSSVMQAQKSGVEGSAFIEPGLAERLQQSLLDAAKNQEALAKPLVLLVAAPLRQMLAKFIRMFIPDMHVLAFTEVPENKRLTIDASINVDTKAV
ncbi:MAG: flagellar biosynthesis protein FlhA [Cellvibrionaceae bacterium]|nr:flagellar biosynthesis protein FlhA [Cellvibrionaceae bacterium]